MLSVICSVSCLTMCQCDCTKSVIQFEHSIYCCQYLLETNQQLQGRRNKENTLTKHTCLPLSFFLHVITSGPNYCKNSQPAFWFFFSLFSLCSEILVFSILSGFWKSLVNSTSGSNSLTNPLPPPCADDRNDNVCQIGSSLPVMCFKWNKQTTTKGLF